MGPESGRTDGASSAATPRRGPATPDEGVPLAAAEAPRRDGEDYRTLYQRTPAMLHSIDAEGRLIGVSDRWLERLGYGADEVIGRHATEFLTPASARFARERALPEFFATGESKDVPYQMLAKDGSVVDVLLSATSERGADGAVVRSLAVLTDVTELHDAQAARDEAHASLQRLMGNLPGMVYRSQAVEPWTDEIIAGGDVSITGFTPEQLTAPGFRWSDIMAPEDIPVLEAASRAAEASGRGEAEYRVRDAAGAWRWLMDRFTLVRDEEGGPAVQEGILIDVTARHAAEEDLAASRAELELHARIATIFLTAAPERMFLDLVDLVRDALGGRWGFFGYLDDDGALVTPSMDAEVWDACAVVGKSLRFPREDWGDNLWSRVLTTGDTQFLHGRGRVPDGHLRIERAVASPIVHRDETIGILMAAGRESPFGGPDARLLETIAAVTAPVLHEWRERLVHERARQEAEEALRESEERYRFLFEGSPTGVALYDPGLRLVDCNPAFAEIAGAPLAQVLGRTADDPLTDPALHAALSAPLRGEEGDCEGRYGAPLFGRDRWLAVKTAPRLSRDGAVAGGIMVVLDRSEQRAVEDRVRHLLLHDPVTGLANRTLLADRVGRTLAHAQRGRLGLALAALEIDRFEALADTLGAEATESLLIQTGHRLRAALRNEDTLSHVGGGRFIALLPGIAGAADAETAAEKLLAVLGDPLLAGAHEVFPTGSLGVAVYPTDGVTTGSLLDHCETAMRQAAVAGGSRWQFFHPSMSTDRDGRLAVEGELHRALDGDQFFLEFQPVVRPKDGSVSSAEALLRWHHPERGIVMPPDFIPLAEESGLMVPIGRWVLAAACRQAREWERTARRSVRIAVNISARQLHDESLVADVRSALRESGLDPRSLELEMTETAAMRDPRHTGLVLGALRAMGVSVALDDFGTGYSSLSHLARLPVATVKIDGSFVRDVATVPEHAAIASSVIVLARRLGLRVVAEGVETEEEAAFLLAEGCEELQGFLHGRPRPADALVDALIHGLAANPAGV